MKHEFYMKEALIEAEKAFEKDEVPIGAVLINAESGDILARAHNLTRQRNDPTAHAEILCIREVCRRKYAQRIPGHILYVTLEPCPMCTSAASFARLDHIVFGARDPKSGGLESGPQLMTHSQLHHKVDYTGNVLAEPASTLLKTFFSKKR